MNKLWIVLATFCIRRVKAKNRHSRSDRWGILEALRGLGFSIGYKADINNE